MISVFRMLKKIKKIWSWNRIIRNLYFLLKFDLEKETYELSYRIKDEVLEECAYELEEYKKQLVSLNVLDSIQTIKLLKTYPKSFSRFGDGEIHIMEGYDQSFQIYDPVLAKKMEKLLSNKRDDIYIGLNQAYFQSPQNFAERNKKFYRVNATRYRRFFTEKCDPENIYLDSSCFGAYYRYGDSFDYEGFYSQIKSLFLGKKIAIVSGEGVFEKLSYNVFENADSIMVLHGPRINAFSQYEKILSKINSNVPKDYLICLILGQTATVLVSDLTDQGYIAWDVGHVAKDYDAYMKRMEKTQKNMDEFWAPD